MLLVLAARVGHAQSSKGTAVVAANEAARPAAKELARLVYRDAKLRPSFDETVARALLGEAPSEEGQAKEIAGVMAGLDTSDEAVTRRVLASTGKELGVSLLVLVESDEQGPRARVLRVSEQRFLGVTLTPKPLEGGAFDWQDGVALLRNLPEAQPLPGPRRTNLPKQKPHKKNGRQKNGAQKNGAKKNGHKPDTGEKSDETPNLLTSPWFWGGLGVVVSVGVTVLVLSQTVFKDDDAVTLEGRVSP
jgi:hypothetical protein